MAGASNETKKSSRFAAIYEATAASMQAEMSRLRAGMSHSGARGAAAEEILRKFLRASLPGSLGVTVGQVVDADGNFSGQSDVIIYDAQGTPMLFSSVEDGQETVPIEGVIAVIEVKSRLQRSDLDQLVSHAAKLKTMSRRAFFPTALSFPVNVYDRTWDVPPVFYSVFAFESDGLYCNELNELSREVEPHHRVDNVCALDRGLLVNIIVGHITDPDTMFSLGATATRTSILGEANPPNPLMPWFAMNASLYAQIGRPPVNLAVYVEDELRMDVRSRDVDSRIQDEVMQQFSDQHGIPLRVVRAVRSGEPVQPTPEEILALVDPFANGNFDLEDGPIRQLLKQLVPLTLSERIAFLSRGPDEVGRVGG